MSERIRRARRPEPRPSGGVPAWAVVLGLVAVVGLVALGLATQDRPREPRATQDRPREPRETGGGQPPATPEPMHVQKARLDAKWEEKIEKAARARAQRVMGQGLSDELVQQELNDQRAAVRAEAERIRRVTELGVDHGYKVEVVIAVTREVEREVLMAGPNASLVCPDALILELLHAEADRRAQNDRVR